MREALRGFFFGRPAADEIAPAACPYRRKGFRIMPKATKKYKLKTYKAAAKRFRVTGSGKILRTKGSKGHLRRRMSKRTKQMRSEMIEVTSPGNRRRIKRLAPYLKKYKANPPA
jgi:large subunit ribosomal protein L35